jgi:hypothetical protein
MEAPGITERNSHHELHRCKTPNPAAPEFNENGWYSDSCNAGPYNLGAVSESDTARLALALNNMQLKDTGKKELQRG